MTPTPLDLHCLNALCDDYENIASIMADVRRFLYDNVTEREISECLIGLEKSGWVAAYEFNTIIGKYIEVGESNGDRSRLWFLITDQGRKKLDENWVDK